MLMLRFTYAFTRSEEIFDISNGGKHGEIIAFINRPLVEFIFP